MQDSLYVPAVEIPEAAVVLIPVVEAVFSAEDVFDVVFAAAAVEAEPIRACAPEEDKLLPSATVTPLSAEAEESV